MRVYMDYDKVKKMCEGGLTFQEMATELGVSRQRAHQIVNWGKGKKLGLKHIRERAMRERVINEQRVFRQEEHKKRISNYGVSQTKQEFMSDTLRAEQHHRLMQKKRNTYGSDVEFDLTWGDLTWPSLCPVLGVPIDYFGDGGGRNEQSCSFDRIDNTRGYVKGNVVVMTWRANRIKNDGTSNEHLKIAMYMESLDKDGRYG